MYPCIQLPRPRQALFLFFLPDLDWFESSFAYPVLVLKDMVQALHPTNPYVQGYYPRYFRNIAAGQTVAKAYAASDCSGNYPICDSSVASYPIYPICPQWKYQASLGRNELR